MGLLAEIIEISLAVIAFFSGIVGVWKRAGSNGLMHNRK